MIGGTCLASSTVIGCFYHLRCYLFIFFIVRGIGRYLLMNSLLEKEGMGQDTDDILRPALQHQVRQQLSALT